MTRAEPQSLSHSLARDTAYNLLSQGINIVLAIGSIPVLIHGLGAEKFGLLALLWAVVGYFGFLDFGISRAITKFLSEAHSKGDRDQLQKIIWTSLSSTLVFGIISAAIVLLIIPLLVDDILNIGVELRDEAVQFFTIAGIGIPLMVVAGSLKGIQMALRRFDLVNIFQSLVGIFQWMGAVVLLWLGYGFIEVVLLTIGSRVALSLAAFALLPKLIPDVFVTIPFRDIATFKKLITFGGWVTLSQLISPLFMYLDRIFIGMLLSLTAVAYYAIPQEALTRVLIVPMSLTAALFPTISEQTVLSVEENKSKLLYDRSIKYVLAIMLPIILGFFLFAREIVTFWLGAEFAVHSVTVFQILIVGLLFNSLAQIPATTLHAFGRPDLTAKFHIIELPFTIVLNLLLIPWIGIEGAAVVWSLRVALDASLLFYAAHRQFEHFSSAKTSSFMNGVFSFLPNILLAIIAALFCASDSLTKVAVLTIFALLYTTTLWFRNFDDADRRLFLQMRMRLFH